MVLYESKHRIVKALEQLAPLGRPLIVCRELTKQFETTYRGQAEEILTKLVGNNLLGEFVVVIGPKPKKLNLNQMKKNKFYITTAIPYVNADPHVGFAMELVETDVLARYHRQIGDDVRFLTGSDENALKMFVKQNKRVRRLKNL